MSSSFHSTTIPKRQSNGLTNLSTHTPMSPGDGRTERTTTSPVTSESSSFVGTDTLLDQFYHQIQQFEEWNKKRDWLAFHHHHYDWWTFPIDEISSRDSAYQLPEDVIRELRRDEYFIECLRRGVLLMVSSWGWDIEKGRKLADPDSKQKWSYWPVRLYKAGKCMWLFEQDDYYQSLKKLARYVRDELKEKLDFFSHTENGKVNVLDRWERIEQTRTTPLIRSTDRK